MLDFEACFCVSRSEGSRCLLPGEACSIVYFHLLRVSSPFREHSSRQMQWAIQTMSDDSGDQSGNNTRLFSAVQSFWDKFSGKLKKLRVASDVLILSDRILLCYGICYCHWANR
uniref:Uncharacterized protein n=1 Tax=Arundo donax TaxID=35708 RepID=A0A0A9FRR5_ARUDO